MRNPDNVQDSKDEACLFTPLLLRYTYTNPVSRDETSMRSRWGKISNLDGRRWIADEHPNLKLGDLPGSAVPVKFLRLNQS